MGHVPQRPIHRARHQGAERLRRRAIAHRAGIRHEGRSDARHLGVLLEPTSVVAKAWDQSSAWGARASWPPRRALVTGAGPVGLLAALIGVQRGSRCMSSTARREGAKPELARARRHLSLRPISGTSCPDIVIECTGAAVGRARRHRRASRQTASFALPGVSAAACARVRHGRVQPHHGAQQPLVFGTVNANRRHYERAAEALATADRGWLRGLITRRVPLARWPRHSNNATATSRS